LRLRPSLRGPQCSCDVGRLGARASRHGEDAPAVHAIVTKGLPGAKSASDASVVLGVRELA
jgi:hypothetical protein